MSDEPIIVGKRVTTGVSIGALVSIFAYFWEEAGHTPLPVPITLALTTVLTGIAQVVIANVLGVTTRKDIKHD